MSRKMSIILLGVINIIQETEQFLSEAKVGIRPYY